MIPESPTCPECNAPMVLRATAKYRYPNGDPRKFWGCSRFPECRAVHGAHPDGRPLGTPGDVETKEARMIAHERFDRLWKGAGRRMSRNAAYRLLQGVMGMGKEEAHIGRFTREQCEELVRRLEAMP